MPRMLLYIGVTFFSVFLSGLAQAGDSSLDFESCKLKDSYGRVLRKVNCTTVSVPENYDKPEGKKIELFVVKFEARKKNIKKDPLLLITGGPGQGASESFAWPWKAFGKLRDERDIYLIDQRGTGRSNPMDCDINDADKNVTNIDPVLIKLRAQECLAQLPGDPRFYTTSVAVKDLEFVRDRLGVTQWNIYGLSYGTRVVQHYIRQHPTSIRTAIVDGVAPVDFNLGPAIPRDSQATLNQVFTRCEASPSCQKQFPRFKYELTQLLAQLKQKPIKTRFENFSSGKVEEFELTIGYVQGFIRMSVYRDNTMATIPLVVHEAVANKNYSMLARIAKKISDQVTDSMSMGMHHSVICTEDAPYYSKQEIDRARSDVSYISVEFIETLQALCSIWPKGVIDSNFKQALTSDVPVLIMSGSADPVTPAANGDHLAKTLSNSKHLIVSDHGHGVYEVGCMPSLTAQFIQEASVKNINGKCLEKQLADPFFININTAGP